MESLPAQAFFARVKKKLIRLMLVINLIAKDHLMNVEEQKKIANEILVKVKWTIDSEAIIAGGAPRNWSEGKLANDIDLYMRSNCVNTAGRLRSQIAKVIFDCHVGDLETYQDVEIGEYTFGVDLEIVKLLGVIYKGIKFQFIILNGNKQYSDFKKQIVSHMDIGINRQYVDWYSNHDSQIIKLKEAIKDEEDKTLTLFVNCMTPSQLKHCMAHHLPKMQEYYPDYKLTMNTEDHIIKL